MVSAGSISITDEIKENAPVTNYSPTTTDSTSIEASDAKIFYCLTVDKIAVFCCVKTITIYQGLIIIAYIEVFSAILALIFMIFSGPYYNIYYTFSTIARILGLISGALCYYSAKTYSVASASIVYHWKIWEPFMLGILRMLGLIKELTDRLGDDSAERVAWLILSTSALIVLNLVYSLYVCYLLYSFIQLVNTNKQKLILYGPDVLNEMIRIRNRAEVIGMQPIRSIETYDNKEPDNKL